jgi:hypothetical protein
MSRPPQYEQHTPLAARKGVIDFVGVPQYTAQYQPEDCIQSSFPPQGPYPPNAAYPYTGVQAPYPSVQASYAAPVYPAYPSPTYPQPAYVHSQYQAPYPQSQYMAAHYSPAEPVASHSPITEESLREKINTKIESIMDSHRAEVLSNQIERLSDKVQRLSRNIEASNVRPTPSQASLPRSLSPLRSASPSIESERDEELSKRLRRLAAESNKQLKQRF